MDANEPKVARFATIHKTSSACFLTYDDLVTAALNPATTAKKGTACILPSDCHTKTKSDVERHNNMTLLWVDIDNGDRSTEWIKQRLADLGITNYLIYSTASANREKNGVKQSKRWRVLIHTTKGIPCDEWLNIQQALADALGGGTEAVQVQQVMFLPTNPDGGYYDYHINEGEPLDPDNPPKPLQAQRTTTTDWLKKEVRAKPKPRKISNVDGGIIEMVNNAYAMEDVLHGLGYKQHGRRLLHPSSQSGVAGVVILNGRYYSHHSISTDPLADGCTHDVFDVLCHWYHGGDVSAAIKHFANELDPEGQKQRRREYMAQQDAARQQNATAAGGGDGFKELLPLREEAQRAEYPIAAFPDDVSDVIVEYQAYAQMPIAVVANTALACLSLPCQCHANVARDNQLVSPISLNILTVADSGERKSAADSKLTAPLRAWLRKQRTATREEIKRLQPDVKAWEEQEKGLLQKIRNATDGAKAAEHKAQLVNHHANKPEIPKMPELFLSDTNQASLVQEMLDNALYGCALWDDEGGNIIGGNGTTSENIMAYFSVLNKLWDGKIIKQSRTTNGNRHLEGRRATVNIMVQQQIVFQLINGKDGLSRGCGLLARFLIAQPQSAMGHRPYKEPPEALQEKLAIFGDRLCQLMEHEPPIDEHGNLDLPTLKLSDDAFEVWKEFYNATESAQAAGEELESVRDIASKIAENATRIAANLHIFMKGGAIGDIDADTMERACIIAMYYLQEAKRIYGMVDTEPAILDAEKLLNHLKSEGYQPATKGDLLKRSPLRNKAALDPALNTLADHGIIKIEKDGKKNTIVVNPEYIAQVSK